MQLTVRDILKKLSNAELNVIKNTSMLDFDVDDEKARRSTFRNFRPDRLLMLADLLDGKGKFRNKGVNAKNFDMATFFSITPDDVSKANQAAADAPKIVEMGCGFAACACGHAGLRTEFRKQGFKTERVLESDTNEPYFYERVAYKGKQGFDAAGAFFGISFQDTEDLFNYVAKLGKKGNTPEAVAKRLRDFVKERKVEIARLKPKTAKKAK